MTNVSRRTVAKGAAWAVPVVAVGAAAPAMAASPGLVELSGVGCKLPGNSNDIFKGYAFDLSASNTTDSDVTINILSVTLNGTDLGNAVVVNFDGCANSGLNTFTVPANSDFPNLALVTELAANSANGTLVVEYEIDGTGETGFVTATVTSTPPINGASCTVFTQAEKDCLSTLNTSV